MGRSTRAFDNYHDQFGRHVRSCRRARGLTQEALAATSGLSADTIRRLEHGSFSPSLVTLRKLSIGLELSLPTLFEAHELREQESAREVADMVMALGPRALDVVLRVLPLVRELLQGPEATDDDK